MKTGRLERMVPPGFPVKKELALYEASLVPGILFSLTFFIRYLSYYEKVKTVRQYPEYGPYIDEAYWMPGFEELLGTMFGNTFVFFGLTAAVIAGILVYHYAYYFQESKSIYLMRRLPEKKEWHVRALVLPVLEAVLTLLIMGVLYMIFWSVYRFATPADWIR